MSNKSKSRKRKQLLKFLNSFDKKLNFLLQYAAFRENYKKYLESQIPKLATGGISWEPRPLDMPRFREFYMHINHTYPIIVPDELKSLGKILIDGGEILVPIKSTGATPYDNDQYMFQED